MNLHKVQFLTVVFIFMASLTSCSEPSSPTDFDAVLSNVTTWPYEVEAVFDVADAHQNEDDKLDWAAAILFAKGYEKGVNVFVEGHVLEDADLDIETEEYFKVTLGQPNSKYGPGTYIVLKIRAL